MLTLNPVPCPVIVIVQYFFKKPCMGNLSEWSEWVFRMTI
jgi:hypothetical protein